MMTPHLRRLERLQVIIYVAIAVNIVTNIAMTEIHTIPLTYVISIANDEHSAGTKCGVPPNWLGDLDENTKFFISFSIQFSMQQRRVTTWSFVRDALNKRVRVGFVRDALNKRVRDVLDKQVAMDGCTCFVQGDLDQSDVDKHAVVLYKEATGYEIHKFCINNASVRDDLDKLAFECETYKFWKISFPKMVEGTSSAFLSRMRDSGYSLVRNDLDKQDLECEICTVWIGSLPKRVKETFPGFLGKVRASRCVYMFIQCVGIVDLFLDWKILRNGFPLSEARGKDGPFIPCYASLPLEVSKGWG